MTNFASQSIIIRRRPILKYLAGFYEALPCKLFPEIIPLRIEA
jgi:hypothetical protein